MLTQQTKNIEHIPLSSNIEIIIVMAMLNFVIYISTLSRAEGHKYQIGFIFNKTYLRLQTMIRITGKV